MKCLYCHENVRPDGDTCPKCGLPLIEDTTLLEFRGDEKPTFADWLNEHRSVILAGVGGFAAAVAVGLIFITSTSSARSEGKALVPAATVPQQPVQLSTSASVGGGSIGAQPSSMVSGARLSTPPAQPAVVPAVAATSEPTVAAEVPEQTGDISAPPPLPANFEHDPAWGFEPAPKPNRPRLPEPEDEPTAPQHVLAMSPFRERKAQYVIVVQQSVGGSAEVDNSPLPIQ
jgi:hypothetical protein